MCKGKIVKTNDTLNFNMGLHTSLNKSNTINLECIYWLEEKQSKTQEVNQLIRDLWNLAKGPTSSGNKGDWKITKPKNKTEKDK